MSAENLIHRLMPHQGCVITRTVDGIDIAGPAMNWVMSAGVAWWSRGDEAGRKGPPYRGD